MKRISLVFAVLFLSLSSVSAKTNQDILASMTSYVINCDEAGHCFLVLESSAFKNIDSPRALITAKNNNGLWRRFATVEGHLIKISFNCHDQAEQFLKSHSWTIERRYS